VANIALFPATEGVLKSLETPTLVSHSNVVSVVCLGCPQGYFLCSFY
jgi:hypothetical protein